MNRYSVAIDGWPIMTPIDTDAVRHYVTRPETPTTPRMVVKYLHFFQSYFVLTATRNISGSIYDYFSDLLFLELVFVSNRSNHNDEMLKAAKLIDGIIFDIIWFHFVLCIFN